MAANIARFAVRNTLRGLTHSTKNNSRICAREVMNMTSERCFLRRSRVVGCLDIKLNNHSTLVQATSGHLTQFAPIINIDIASNISCVSTDASEAMEESSSEGEEEATNGRKRIKPRELHSDDP